MVVPWKYGFKSIKSIVQDPFRGKAAAHHLEHRQRPRVRLLFERESRRGSSALEPGAASAASANSSKRKTLMFNGYGDQVASLYAGMDLQKELLRRCA